MIRLILLLILFIPLNLLADSPLTEIEFWKSYQSNPLVSSAEKSKKLSNKSIEFILNQNKPLEEKLAIINAIGWEFKSHRNNANKLKKAILKRYNISNIDNLDKQDHSGILSVYIYTYAMENYLDLTGILRLSEKLGNVNINNPCVQYILDLIKSQHYFHQKEYCNTYKVFENLETFNKDEKFVKNIITPTLEYINIYKNYCQ